MENFEKQESLAAFKEKYSSALASRFTMRQNDADELSEIIHNSLGEKTQEEKLGANAALTSMCMQLPKEEAPKGIENGKELEEKTPDADKSEEHAHED